MYRCYLNTQLSDNEKQDENLHGTTNDDGDPVAALTYVPPQSSKFHPEDCGYPQSGERKNLGYVDLSESQMVTASGRGARAVELVSGSDFNSVETHSLRLYWDRFGFKDFMSLEAQGPPQSALHNANTQQEQEFLESRERIHVSMVQKHPNVNGSHVL